MDTEDVRNHIAPWRRQLLEIVERVEIERERAKVNGVVPEKSPVSEIQGHHTDSPKRRRHGSESKAPTRVG